MIAIKIDAIAINAFSKSDGTTSVIGAGESEGIELSAEL